MHLDSQEELHQEQGGDGVGQDRNFLGLTAEDLHDGVGDQANANGVADGAGDRHADQHERHRHHLVHILEVHVLQALEHQNANVNQRCGSGGSRDDGSNGCDEDTGQEQNAGDQSGQASTATSFHAGSRFHEGGNGGGTGASANDSADGIRQQGFLHVGHIAVFIHHAGTGGGTHQGADGVEHINDAECDCQGDDGKPANFNEALEVELEEGNAEHICKGRQEGSRCQGCKGIGVQEQEGADPVDHGSDQHAKQDSTLDAFLGHGHNGKQADKHGDDSQDHGSVASIAHIGLQHAGGQGAEEVTHDIEGSGKTVALGVDAHIGAQADVHQHKADGRRDAQTDAQRNGFHDFLTDIQDRQEQEHDAFHQNNDQSSLERSHIAHAGHGNNVTNDHSKEAVQAHAGSHGEGLVRQERHAEHTNGGSNTSGHEHTVPQVRTASAEVGQQIGVQGNDVGHGHEGGQASHDFGLHICAVFRELKEFLKHTIYLSFIDSGKKPVKGQYYSITFVLNRKYTDTPNL